MLLFGLTFIIFNIFLILNINNFSTILVIFGLVSIYMVKVDFNNYFGKINISNFWLLIHIQRIMGYYIAASTAFLVVNYTCLTSIITWFLSTVIITPLIIIWSKKHKIVK